MKTPDTKQIEAWVAQRFPRHANATDVVDNLHGFPTQTMVEEVQAYLIHSKARDLTWPDLRQKFTAQQRLASVIEGDSFLDGDRVAYLEWYTTEEWPSPMPRFGQDVEPSKIKKTARMSIPYRTKHRRYLKKFLKYTAKPRRNKSRAHGDLDAIFAPPDADVDDGVGPAESHEKMHLTEEIIQALREQNEVYKPWGFPADRDQYRFLLRFHEEFGPRSPSLYGRTADCLKFHHEASPPYIEIWQPGGQSAQKRHPDFTLQGELYDDFMAWWRVHPFRDDEDPDSNPFILIVGRPSLHGRMVALDAGDFGNAMARRGARIGLHQTPTVLDFRSYGVDRRHEEGMGLEEIAADMAKSLNQPVLAPYSVMRPERVLGKGIRYHQSATTKSHECPECQTPYAPGVAGCSNKQCALFEVAGPASQGEIERDMLTQATAHLLQLKAMHAE